MAEPRLRAPVSPAPRGGPCCSPSARATTRCLRNIAWCPVLLGFDRPIVGSERAPSSCCHSPYTPRRTSLGSSPSGPPSNNGTDNSFPVVAAIRQRSALMVPETCCWVLQPRFERRGREAYKIRQIIPDQFGRYRLVTLLCERQHRHTWKIDLICTCRIQNITYRRHQHRCPRTGGDSRAVPSMWAQLYSPFPHFLRMFRFLKAPGTLADSAKAPKSKTIHKQAVHCEYMLW